MDFKLDVSTLLYAIGIILGIVSVVYFGRSIIADLSPTIKSVLLLLGFPVLFVSGDLIQKRIIDKFFYLLSAVSYVVFLWYAFGTFELGGNFVFLILVLSSVLFLSLGYLKSREVNLKSSWKKITLIVLIALMIGLTSFDVMGAQPKYDLQLEDSINFEGVWERDEQRIRIGTLEVRNDFVFSRFTHFPELRACLYTPGKHEIYPYYSRWEVNIVGGGETENIEVSIYPPRGEELGKPPAYMENIKIVPIEGADSCPEEVEEPKLIVTTGGRF